jgi:hypothetical protein
LEYSVLHRYIVLINVVFIHVRPHYRSLSSWRRNATAVIPLASASTRSSHSVIIKTTIFLKQIGLYPSTYSTNRSPATSLVGKHPMSISIFRVGPVLSAHSRLEIAGGTALE